MSDESIEYTKYQLVKAIVEDESEFVTFVYQRPGSSVERRHVHDEPVGHWSDEEIQMLANDLIDADPSIVQVERRF